MAITARSPEPEWLKDSPVAADCRRCGAEFYLHELLPPPALLCSACAIASGEWLSGPPGYIEGKLVRKMAPEGRGTSGVLAIGEAPGEHEEQDGLPFRPYAEAGSVLERALWRAGIDRVSLTLSNLVWYRPPNYNWLEGAPYERDAILHCERFNDDLVARVRPRAILALGALAFRELTGLSGDKLGIENCRGFIVPCVKGAIDVDWRLPNGAPIPVIGTYHPSYLRRGSKQRSKENSPAAPKDKSAGGGTAGFALMGAVIRDIQLACQVARTGYPIFSFDDYRLGATLADWRRTVNIARANPALPISYDFETSGSIETMDESEMDITSTLHLKVTQVQASLKSGTAVVSPWTPDLLPLLRELLELPNPKLDWNGRKFDRPILREMGIRTDLGDWHDLMDFWHHAQPDLPRGLQYATSFFVPEVGPWKHIIGVNPLHYGALDVDMPQRIFQALKLSCSLTREVHSGISLWSGYLDQTVAVAPVLDRMTAHGIPVDEAARLGLAEKFQAKLAEIGREASTLAPEEVRPIHPKNGYKKIPKECLEAEGQGRLCIEGELWTTTRTKAKTDIFTEGTNDSTPGEGEIHIRGDLVYSASGRDGSPISHSSLISSTDGKPSAENPAPPAPSASSYVLRKFVDEKSSLPVRRWAKLLPFNLAAPQQVVKYIEHRRELDIASLMAKYRLKKPADYSGARAWAEGKTLWVVPREKGKVTTSADKLEPLARKTGDRLLHLVLDHREISKAFGTYVEGWKPGADGCVHPNFGFNPATGQLSSDNPNAQNFPQHSDIAQAMRQMILARPARRFISLDWKSFHVLTVGFESGDPAYARLARLDMHSFFAISGLLKIETPERLIELPDDELSAKLAWYRASGKTYPAFRNWTFGQVRDRNAKVAILAFGFGQTANSLYLANMESFESPKAAQVVQDQLNALFPKPAKWRDAVRLEADTQSYLLTRAGYVRRFFDVFHRKPLAGNHQTWPSQRVYIDPRSGRRWLLTPGDDHEACVAYRPANDAFSIKRRVMADLGRDGLDVRYGLCVEIHDDLKFECPAEYDEECLHEVKKRMEAKAEWLKDPLVAPDGLGCAVDVKAGRNWGAKSAGNPDGMDKVRV